MFKNSWKKGTWVVCVSHDAVYGYKTKTNTQAAPEYLGIYKVSHDGTESSIYDSRYDKHTATSHNPVYIIKKKYFKWFATKEEAEQYVAEAKLSVADKFEKELTTKLENMSEAEKIEYLSKMDA